MRKMTVLVAAVAVTAMAGAAVAQPPGGGRGQLSPEQREAAFKEADKNGDNQLSKEEFVASLPEQAASFADQIFGARDGDGNGQISHEEYMAAPARGGRGG